MRSQTLGVYWYEKKELFCFCSSVYSLLWNTHSDPTFYNGLGFTHGLPIGDGLDTVGLEEFDEAPTVVGTRYRRLVANWARHLIILLWGRLTSIEIHEFVLKDIA